MHGFDYSIPQFITHVRGTRIVVTPNLISEVIHIPRVEFANYPDCERLKNMSKDEISSFFCETPSSWGDHQNTPCSGFAKGPRFLNMVMTFVLHPLSHYNSITFFFFFFIYQLEGFTIDITFHFILSLHMSIGIRRPMISLFSLQLSRGFSTIFLSPILSLHTFLLCVP